MRRRRKRGRGPAYLGALRELLDARDHGHPAKGEILSLAHTGKAEGTRRIRELREDGYVVEAIRPSRHPILGREPGRFYYRIVSVPHEQLTLWP